MQRRIKKNGGMHVPGNMWTVSCSYVSQLLPPEEFKERHEQTIGAFLIMRLRGQMTSNTFRKERMDRYGLDRYAAEHWVGSHPAVRPCDMEASGLFPYWLPHRRVLSEFIPLSFAMAPRRVDPKYAIEKLTNSSLPLKQIFDWNNINGWCMFELKRTCREDRERFVEDAFETCRKKTTRSLFGDRITAVRKKSQTRIREFFLLPGHLLKWLSIYGEAPSTDSWVWDHFPDGEFWKDAVDMFGRAAVDVVTSYVQKPMGSLPLSSFANSSTEIESNFQFQNDTGGSKGVAIFYQWWNSTNNNALDRGMFLVFNARFLVAAHSSLRRHMH
jgi:hypothetical protein